MLTYTSFLGETRGTCGRFIQPLLDRTIVLLAACAILMPVVLPHVGRLPRLLLIVGLALYTAIHVAHLLPSCFRTQARAASVIVAFYWCSAITSVKPESLTSVDFGDPTGYHAGIAESLLEHQLNLPIEPSRGLLEAKDPYDPSRDYPFAWDASYYHGKYYIYFGPTPVLTLYLPFRVITGKPLATPFALAAFVTAGFIGSLFLLERARKLCRIPRPQPSLQVLNTVLLGTACLTPVLLRRPSIYEVAVASAYCFLMWGLYVVLGQLSSKPGQHGSFSGALLASVLLALCAASRAPFLATGAFLLVAFALQCHQHWRAERWTVLGRSVPLLAPFALCVFLLGLYNKLRFDQWTTFGMQYQLNHIDLMRLKFDSQKVIRGLVYYLFSAPKLSGGFPPIQWDQTTQPFHFQSHTTFHEGALGLVPVVPVSVALLATPMLSHLHKNRWFGLISALLVGCAVLMLLVDSTAGVTARYEMDFLPSLLVTCVLTSYLLRKQSSYLSIAADLLWVPAAVYSIVIGILASFTEVTVLKTYHLGTYELLHHLISP